MKLKKIIFSLVVLLFSVSVLSAETINYTMTKTSDYSRIDFDSAFTMVWSGTVSQDDSDIGEFNAVLTKTNTTGSNGYIIQYDIVIPGAGSVGDFFSIRANHITTGSGLDVGYIFAASPAYHNLIGATINKDGTDLIITLPSSETKVVVIPL